MDNPLILSALRTPIGRFQGSLAELSAPALAAKVISSVLDTAGVPTDLVDEVILGNVLPAGIGQAPSRQAALLAGLPPSIPAVTINKMCGSGLKAIMLAEQAIRAGDADVIVAGGMESMTQSPYLLPRAGPKLGDRTLIDSMLHDGLTCPFSNNPMGLIADQLAAREDISRADQDQYALESHRRARSAMEAGDLSDEVVPIVSRGQSIERDEGPRDGCRLEDLARLPPVFDAAGTVTAGNASMISDGASAIVVASRRFTKEHGLSPIAEVIGSTSVGTPPEDLFIAPVDAVHRLCARFRVSLAEIDLLEINEAFAAQMLACLRRLKLSPTKVNVAGGAIALGHPIGASGARVVATLIHAMHRQDAARGIATLCLGGGNAVAMMLSRSGSC